MKEWLCTRDCASKQAPCNLVNIGFGHRRNPVRQCSDILNGATGGLAIVRADYCGASNECVTPDGDDALAFSDTKLGLAAGGGAEILVDPNWSLKAEYLFIDTGEGTRTYDDDGKAQFQTSAHLILVGLNDHVRDMPPALEEVDSLK